MLFVIKHFFVINYLSFLGTYLMQNYNTYTTAISSSILKYDIKKFDRKINFRLC